MFFFKRKLCRFACREALFDFRIFKSIGGSHHHVAFQCFVSSSFQHAFKLKIFFILIFNEINDVQNI